MYKFILGTILYIVLLFGLGLTYVVTVFGIFGMFFFLMGGSSFGVTVMFLSLHYELAQEGYIQNE